jgi:hypothetical protein
LYYISLIEKLAGFTVYWKPAHHNATFFSGPLANLSLVCVSLVSWCAGCLPHLVERIKQKGHAVVVVAEGAGEELLGQSVEKGEPPIILCLTVNESP